MPTTTILINPRDPLIARDGRPFGIGNRAHCLDWLPPSTVAGTLRTLVGKCTGGDFDQETIASLLGIHITGPFPWRGGELFLPAPLDAVYYPGKISSEEEGPRVTSRGTIHAIRPLELAPGEGCDLPHASLHPVGLSPEIKSEFKPARVPQFWAMSELVKWLFMRETSCPAAFPPPEQTEGDQIPIEAGKFLSSIPKESRFHTQVDPDTGTAQDEHLFSTTGLVLRNPMTIRARTNTPSKSGGQVREVEEVALQELNGLHPLGGERRLAHWVTGADQVQSKSPWDLPDPVRQAISADDVKRVRMVLASPGLFAEGWKPGWLAPREDGFVGTPPSSPGIKLRLVGACVGRWRPISGWSYEARGPKPVRRLVPEGSVYFLEILEGDALELVETAWLESICDDEQDQKDGFGVSVWGIW